MFEVDPITYIDRLFAERDRADAEYRQRVDERFDARDDALKLQAEEYARRLKDLNGEYARDRARQSDYVTIDKYEAQLAAEKTAREAALLRVDEKFDDYVKRYELRQREIDGLLAGQKGAAEQANKTAMEASARATRTIQIAGVLLALIVFLANVLPLVLK
jgi:hypothetical protein